MGVTAVSPGRSQLAANLRVAFLFDGELGEGEKERQQLGEIPLFLPRAFAGRVLGPAAAASAFYVCVGSFCS